MNPGWTDTLDRLDAALAEHLARNPVPPPTPEPPPAAGFEHLCARWEAALDRLDAEADLGPLIDDVTAFRERLRRARGTAPAS